MPQNLTILIVDDEPLARRRIRKLLKDEPIVTSIAEASDGDEAFDKIVLSAPDVVYLDIQMPGCDGFELLKRLGANRPGKMPEVIFVTAYDEYALKAFELHALDYLLKPFDAARFKQSFDFMVNRLSSQGDQDQKLAKLIESLEQKKDYLEWVSIKSEDKISLCRIDDIIWVEAQGNYVLLNINESKHLFREKMDVLESRLDASKFIRIHRSAIVNVGFIREIEVWGRGEHKVVMPGKTFNVSRNYRSKLDAFFEKRVL